MILYCCAHVMVSVWVRQCESIFHTYPINSLFLLRRNLDSHGHPKRHTSLWRGSLSSSTLPCCRAWLRTVQKVNECLGILTNHLEGRRGGGRKRRKRGGGRGGGRKRRKRRKKRWSRNRSNKRRKSRKRI